MFEPNNQDPRYNYSQEHKPTEVTYYPSDDFLTPKKKKHTGIKIFCSVLCALVISAGSIGGYIALTQNMGVTAGDSAPSASSTSSGTQAGSLGSDHSPSLVELASKSNSLSIPDIVKKVKPSVVGVTATFQGNVVQTPFGNFQQGETPATGTGIIASSDGYIITNCHVVYDTESNLGLAKKVMITLNDGDTTEYPATIVGIDDKTDLAVLKIQKNNCTPAEFGNSDELEVGELAIAIGNPLGLELNCSVTAGIISAVDRQITTSDNKTMTLLQTDAAINPGNSGGPLVNSYGQVIGINSSKITSEQVEGLGFAIPISSAKPIVDDLMNNGYVTGRPLIGFHGVTIDAQTASYYNLPQGVQVRFIDNTSGAAQAGLMVSDIVTAIDGQEVKTMEDLNKVKDSHKPGDTVTLTLYRYSNGQTLNIQVVLSEDTTQLAKS